MLSFLDEMVRQLTAVGATVIFGVAPMAELLQKVAQMCNKSSHLVTLLVLYLLC